MANIRLYTRLRVVCAAVLYYKLAVVRRRRLSRSLRF
jgi:hypothetical protein